MANEQDSIKELTGEYNAAVANGLIYKAQRINRIIQALERKAEVEKGEEMWRKALE